jgi:hypothetical protein
MPPPTVPVAWHEGGAGPCDACGAQSDDRSTVQASRPKLLCPRCTRAFVEGDDHVVAAVFLVPPDDASERKGRRRSGVGR